MAIHDFKAQRLFVAADLAPRAEIGATAEQANYLINVLRLGAGDSVLVFNGRDGEWRAEIAVPRKKACTLMVAARVRAQFNGPDVDYLFAPLKHARLDYMVQKAAEMGVRRLRPVITRHTVAERVNLDRMRANAIEAAEQCGILHVPEVTEVAKLGLVLAEWDVRRPLIFCDEGARSESPIAILQTIAQGPIGVIIGPEGGFSSEEREMLASKPCTISISLGPRIMRADTASVAALALINATVGRGW